MQTIHALPFDLIIDKLFPFLHPIDIVKMTGTQKEWSDKKYVAIAFKRNLIKTLGPFTSIMKHLSKNCKIGGARTSNVFYGHEMQNIRDNSNLKIYITSESLDGLVSIFKDIPDLIVINSTAYCNEKNNIDDHTDVLSAYNSVDFETEMTPWVCLPVFTNINGISHTNTSNRAWLPTIKNGGGMGDRKLTEFVHKHTKSISFEIRRKKFKVDNKELFYDGNTVQFGGGKRKIYKL